MMDYKQLIADLSNARGASGFEDEVVEVIKEYAGDYSVHVDNLKNTYLNFQIDPNKPTVMLDSHSDEVGFMVQSIEENGTIRIQPLGGWVAANVIAQEFVVRQRSGSYIPAIIATKPIHFMTESERTKSVSWSDLKLDIGASSRQEVMDVFEVEVGAPILPATQFKYIPQNDTMLGKGFDNRIGCAVVIAVLNELKSEIDQLPFNLVGTCASQEEVGARGAELTARRVQPNMAIVFEGTPSDDFTDAEYLLQGRLGKGSQIRHRDNSYVSNETLIHDFVRVAEEEGLAIQHAVRSGGGTNAGPIHLSNLGVPTAVVGTPVRYTHANANYCSYKDFMTSVQLGAAFLRQLTAEDIARFDLQQLQ